MKWMAWGVTAGAALAVLVAVVGWLLPVAHEASRTTSVEAPPTRTFDLIANVGGYADWVDGVTKVEMLNADGAAQRFRQHGSDGPIVMEVVESRPASRFVTRIADPDRPFGGTWTFDVAPEGTGSRVTITERGEVYNPIFRFVSRFVLGHTRTIDRFLRSLEQRLAR